MASITNPSDYTGKFSITQNERYTAKLQEYIDLYEESYMMELFGVNLYAQYVAGLALMPTPDPLFVKLRDPFYENWDSTYCGCDNQILISKGVKIMLLGFIYWEWYKDSFSKSTIDGKSKALPENSTNSTPNSSGVYERYNESIRTYRAIQEYTRHNSTDYPDFKGVEKRFSNWF